jgi:hypothetical protein
MITNPPYIGISSLEKEPKSYLIKHYPDSKSDLFAMFMEGDLVKLNGFKSLISMHSWMFLTSYEKLRFKISCDNYICTMIHLGPRAFEEIAGEVVQTTAFVLRNSKLPEYNGIYYRLVNSKNKEYDFVSRKEGLRFIASGNIFLKVPGVNIVYWAETNIIEAFKNPCLENYVLFRQGMATSDNNRFIRYWYEPSLTNISFNSYDIKSAKNSNKKWFPYNKGGEVRNWYGNQYYVVNWFNDGEEMKQYTSTLNQGMNVRLKSREYYFKETISWSKISSKNISFRYYPQGFIFDVAGPCIFDSKLSLYYLLGLVNSQITKSIMELISPTLNFELDHLKKMPVIVSEDLEEKIANLVSENITIAKTIWDLSETSWEFKRNYIIKSSKLQDGIKSFLQYQKDLLEKLKENEYSINKEFSEMYKIENKNGSTIDIEYPINFSDHADLIKSFISYLIGVLMGRYSLAEEGLIYAGGDFDHTRYGNYDVDQDGIIPIFPDLSFENGLVHRIIKLIKNVYGDEDYRENIEFIANALGKKTNETSEETLNRYLNQEFCSDHLKTYQKRPIYWMFSSGKKNGFKALIYMHRYNSNTLAKMNASYFQPATTLLRTRISEIEKQIFAANDKEKVQLERLRFSLIEQLNEAIEYGQVLDYMANKYISIDLDDGVKVNYAKFQDIEISTSNGKVKKDLLVPVK